MRAILSLSLMRLQDTHRLETNMYLGSCRRLGVGPTRSHSRQLSENSEVELLGWPPGMCIDRLFSSVVPPWACSLRHDIGHGFRVLKTAARTPSKVLFVQECLLG